MTPEKGQMADLSDYSDEEEEKIEGEINTNYEINGKEKNNDINGDRIEPEMTISERKEDNERKPTSTIGTA